VARDKVVGGHQCEQKLQDAGEQIEHARSLRPFPITKKGPNRYRPTGPGEYSRVAVTT
jgi:hypothetical protein